MTTVADIKSLIRTKGFRQIAVLAGKRNQFNLLEMLETTVTENAWSRVVAFLFDSRGNHGFGKEAFLKWLRLVEIPKELKVLGERKSVQSVTQTEFVTSSGRRLDILVRLFDSRGRVRAVIGIENKVWSGEQMEQVGDYQNSLSRAFPKIPKIVVFLTPDGRQPKTADLVSARCRTIVARYDTLTDICEALSHSPTVNKDVRILLSHLAGYIEKRIAVAEERDNKARRFLYELYSNPMHREALRLIRDHLPSVGNLLESFTDKVEKAFRKLSEGSEFRWLYWPVRSISPQQIKLIPDELSARTAKGRGGFEINYMLHCPQRNPDIGDDFTLVVSAWCNPRSRAAKAAAARLVLKGWRGDWKPTGSWTPLWVGGTHRLVDLGENDAAVLAKLMIDSLRQTYLTLVKRLVRS